MSWSDLHQLGQAAAMDASVALLEGKPDAAAANYAKAADLEEQAMAAIEPAKARTLGITAVSAVALRYKSGDLARAEQLALGLLSNPALPEFAKAQIREILQAIWSGRQILPGEHPKALIVFPYSESTEAVYREIVNTLDQLLVWSIRADASRVAAMIAESHFVVANLAATPRECNALFELGLRRTIAIAPEGWEPTPLDRSFGAPLIYSDSIDGRRRLAASLRVRVEELLGLHSRAV